jgi:hypothetical protein
MSDLDTIRARIELVKQQAEEAAKRQEEEVR